jgi:ABC-type transporter Mla subunit MlaD
VFYNSVIELASSPLGSSIIFYPGKKKTGLIAEHSLIPSIDSPDGRAILSARQADMPDKSEDTISNIIQNVDEITTGINNLVKNNSGELDAIIKSLSRTTLALADAMEGKPTGPVGQTLVGLSDIVKNLKTLTDDMNGLIPKLLDPTGKEVYPAIRNVLQNIEAISVQLKGFADFIAGTEPQIAGILEQVPAVLDKGKSVLEGLSNNPLLSGGITKEREQPSTFKSFRDEAF